MAEILLFHHAYGLTDGLRDLAARLTAEGHTVHCPDCYAGVTFKRLDDGLAHAQRIGHDAVEDVARRSAREHRSANVVTVMVWLCSSQSPVVVAAAISPYE